MPGTITFRPLEANLTHNTDIITKMNPYCAFIIGNQRIYSQISKHGGKHPHWSDSVTVPFNNESKITIELMDRDRITNDGRIGKFTIGLPELQAQGESSKWYSLFYKNKPAGEILLEASVENQEVFGQENIFIQSQYIQQENIINQPVIAVEKEKSASEKSREGVKTFIEQRQTVEPHTFLKEIDVVETRPVQQIVEVFEPRKVLKEVQYTELVPVKKMIETIEPQVVTKEIEVIEPMLVTKTIQVVENFPVKKQIEVIKSVPVLKDIDTYEPQTFTKKIEIIEHVPVMKNVTVIEPVHLKKSVEFVEPIITTKTITKKIRPEVIVNQQITKSIGPATYLGELKDFSRISLSESERFRMSTEAERLSADVKYGLSQSQQILTRKETKFAEKMRPSRIQSQRDLIDNNRL